MTCLILTLVLNGVMMHKTIRNIKDDKLVVHLESGFFQGLECPLSTLIESVNLALGLIRLNVDFRLSAYKHFIPLLEGSELITLTIEGLQNYMRQY